MAKRKKCGNEKKKIVVSDAIKWPSGKISGGTDLMIKKICKCKENTHDKKQKDQEKEKMFM